MTRALLVLLALAAAAWFTDASQVASGFTHILHLTLALSLRERGFGGSLKGY
jgi:hypothetical protein